MSAFMIENRKCKTLSVVKDFQNFLDAFFCTPYTFPLLLSCWRENQGRGDIFQDSCHVSLLLWKSLRFQRPRGNFSPARPSRPFGVDGHALWLRCPGRRPCPHLGSWNCGQRLAEFLLLFSSFKGKCKVLFNLAYLNFKKNLYLILLLENSFVCLE